MLKVSTKSKSEKKEKKRKKKRHGKTYRAPMELKIVKI